MAKIITAFRDRQTARQIAAALEASGLSVFRVCATGNEVMRAFNQCSDGILVCGTAFADRTVDSLCEDLGERALVLAVGRPENLDNCEYPALFRLTSPFSRSELIASVNMLVQLHGQRLPRRSGEERELVERAKRKLMDEQHLTEDQAHRLLQSESMRHGFKMTESARRVLGES